MSDDEEDKKIKSKTKTKKEPQTFIRENEDAIVDLADPNAFSKITSKYCFKINYRKLTAFWCLKL